MYFIAPDARFLIDSLKTLGYTPLAVSPYAYLLAFHDTDLASPNGFDAGAVAEVLRSHYFSHLQGGP